MKRKAKSKATPKNAREVSGREFLDSMRAIVEPLGGIDLQVYPRGAEEGAPGFRCCEATEMIGIEARGVPGMTRLFYEAGLRVIVDADYQSAAGFHPAPHRSVDSQKMLEMAHQ